MNAAGVERAYILGHSLGGMIGTRLLQEANAELLGFVNCEGNLTLEDAGMSRTIVSQSFEYFSATGYSQIKTNLLSSGESSALLRVQWLRSVPDYVMYRTCQAIVEQSLDPSFAQLFYATEIPRMYLHGDANVSKAERIPNTPDLKKVSVPNSGHFMLLDNPAFSYRAIE
jgi:pimeloyl-ACP methyl ester carboxylesterase